MRGAGQPPRTTAVASFPYPIPSIPAPYPVHSRTHPVIPAPILSFPHPSCHSREGGNLAPCGRRAFIGTPHTQ